MYVLTVKCCTRNNNHYWLSSLNKNSLLYNMFVVYTITSDTLVKNDEDDVVISSVFVGW